MVVAPMYLTEEVASYCPYCGESISIVVDLSALDEEPSMSFIEDCEVCCRPIEFTAAMSGMGAVELTAQDENDAS